MLADDLRTVDVADVYKGDVLAGQLVREGTDITFRYRPEYQADPQTSPVSWSIPKSQAERRSTGESVPPFFAGLLPEGVRLRAIVAGTKTSEDDHMTLLLAVGADTVGDVRVVPEGSMPKDPAPAFDAAQADEADLYDIFGRLAGHESLSVDRVAIPGVQPKTSAALVSTPLMTAGGPAILKLNPADGYPLLVENENFFLNMAKACELRVPEHDLIHDRYGRSGLLLHRFDRAPSAVGVARLPQEDSCQVLDVYPARKYRLKTEEVISMLASRCEEGGGSRQAAMLQISRLVAFSYLIGNGDLHGKNFSIRQPAGGPWEPTPAYDLVCTQPYLRWRDPMALDFYGRANRLTYSHFMSAAERLGIAPRAVGRMLGRLCDRAWTWVDQVEQIGFDERRTDLLARLLDTRIRELSPP